MASSEKIKEVLTTLSDQIVEQEWFKTLQGKLEELDPQSRSYLKFATFGSGVLLVFVIILSSIWNVHSLKAELAEKRKLLNLIQTANDEMRQIQDKIPGGGTLAGREAGPWSSYFDSITMNAGVDKGSLSIVSEKAGNSNDQTKETLFDLNLKHVSIKQIIRYAFSLENGQRPVKLRNLSIDTKNDPSGYMDALLSVSAFNLVTPQ